MGLLGKKGWDLLRFGCLHDIYVEDLDIILRLLLIHPGVLNFVDDIQALNSPSENCVLIIKPWLLKLVYGSRKYGRSNLQSSLL